MAMGNSVGFKLCALLVCCMLTVISLHGSSSVDAKRENDSLLRKNGFGSEYGKGKVNKPRLATEKFKVKNKWRPKMKQPILHGVSLSRMVYYGGGIHRHYAKEAEIVTSRGNRTSLEQCAFILQDKNAKFGIMNDNSSSISSGGLKFDMQVPNTSSLHHYQMQNEVTKCPLHHKSEGLVEDRKQKFARGMHSTYTKTGEILKKIDVQLKLRKCPLLLDGASTKEIARAVSLQREKMTSHKQNLFRAANMQGVTFAHQDLSNFDFSHANLTGATFQGARLNNANLSHATMKFVTLRGSVGSFVDFSRADLSSSTVSFSIFQGSTFKGSNISQAIIYDSDFSFSDFHYASLRNSLLDHVSINSTLFDSADIMYNDITSIHATTVVCGGTSKSSCSKLTKASTYESNYTFSELNSTPVGNDIVTKKSTSSSGKLWRPKAEVTIRTVNLQENQGLLTRSKNEKTVFKKSKDIIYNKGTILDAYRVFELYRQRYTKSSTLDEIYMLIPVSIAILFIVLATVYIIVSPTEIAVSDAEIPTWNGIKEADSSRAASDDQKWLEANEDDKHRIPVAFEVDFNTTIANPRLPVVVQGYGDNEWHWKSAKEAASQRNGNGVAHSLTSLSESLFEKNIQSLSREDVVKMEGNPIYASDSDSEKSTTRPNTPVTSNKITRREVAPLHSSREFSVGTHKLRDHTSPTSSSIPISTLPTDDGKLMTTLRSLTPRRLRKISDAANRCANDMEHRMQRTFNTVSLLKEHAESMRRARGEEENNQSKIEEKRGGNRIRGATEQMNVYHSPIFEATDDDDKKFESQFEGNLKGLIFKDKSSVRKAPVVDENQDYNVRNSRNPKSKKGSSGNKTAKSPLGNKDLNRMK